jgi:hypothetical protein
MNAVPPGTATPQVPTCATRPCAVCQLRALIQAQVGRDVTRTLPLEVNLVGMRRLPSVNTGYFDDLMALTMALPPAAAPAAPGAGAAAGSTPAPGPRVKLDARSGNLVTEAGGIVLEKEFLQDLGQLVTDANAWAHKPGEAWLQRRIAIPKVLRLVRCSRQEVGQGAPSATSGDRTWIMGLFSLSTDPGLVQRAELKSSVAGLRRSIDALQARIAARKDLEAEVVVLVGAWKKLVDAVKAGSPQADRTALGLAVEDAQKKLADKRRQLQPSGALAAMDAAIQKLRAELAALEKKEAELALADQKKASATAKERAALEKAAAAAKARRDAKSKDLDKQTGEVAGAPGKLEKEGAAEEVDRAKQQAKLDAESSELALVERGKITPNFHLHGGDLYPGVMKVPEGWAGEGRALMPAGLLPALFKVGFHYEAPALQAGYFDGWRVASGSTLAEGYLRYVDFEAALPRILKLKREGRTEEVFGEVARLEATESGTAAAKVLQAWLHTGAGSDLRIEPLDPDKDQVRTPYWKAFVTVRKASSQALAVPRRFKVVAIGNPDHDPSPPARPTVLLLERRDAGPKVFAALESTAEDGTPTTSPVDESAQYVLAARIGATNAHRAHGVNLNRTPEPAYPDRAGVLAPQYQGGDVSNWSVGCQVFPYFDDFNVFLRLCQLSKRWRCATRDGERAWSAATQQLRKTAEDARGTAEELAAKAAEAKAAAAEARAAATEAARAAAAPPPLPAAATPGPAASAPPGGRRPPPRPPPAPAGSPQDLQAQAAWLRADDRARAAEKAADLRSPPPAQAPRGAQRAAESARLADLRATAAKQAEVKAEEARKKAVEAQQAAERDATTAEASERSTLGACARITASAAPARGDQGWETARRDMLEWIRTCDRGTWCTQRFDYALLTLDQAQLDHVALSFAEKADPADDSKGDRYPAWDWSKEPIFR